MLRDYFNYFPAGCSYKQVLHYLQLLTTGKFLEYDHGVEQNIRMYGQALPPEYQLSNVKTNIHLLYGTHDWLAMARVGKIHIYLKK